MERLDRRNTILKCESSKLDWPGGVGKAVAEVGVVLGDLAAHFRCPIFWEHNTLSVVLSSVEIGPVTVVAEILEDRELSDAEVEAFCFTFQNLSLTVGAATNLTAVRRFIQKGFPPWAQVLFYADQHKDRPNPEAYTGPTRFDPI